MLNLPEHWEIDAAALMGALGLMVGVGIRMGRFRRGVRNTYFAPGLPDYQRRGTFVLIPLGAAFLLIAAGMMEFQSRGATPDSADPLGSILLAVGVLALLLGIWWMFRLPGWLKPAWVREYDAARRAGLPVPDLSPTPMSPRAYALNWLGLAVFSLVWLALRLPVGDLLIGVGFGMSLLLANRPTRRV